MGDPRSGEIYEGQLRPGDIDLNKEEIKRLMQLDTEARITEFTRRFREQDAAKAATISGDAVEMPRYKCHKEVWALKIAAIEPIYSAKPTIAELEAILDSNQESPAMAPSGELIGGYRIVPADEGFVPFEISFEYMGKHKPEVGGYFVVYKDGYKSYSPAQAFEEGYTRI